MMTFPIHYPDRPAIPHDPLPDSSNNHAKRWTRKLAEAGKLSGRPVKQIPHYGKTDEPSEVIA